MDILTSSTGSYPRICTHTESQQHRQACASLESGVISDAEFGRIEDEVTKEVIKEQVDAGLDFITDGLVRWQDPISHLSRRLNGCEINGLLRFFDSNFYFRQPIIKDRISRRESILKREFIFAKSVSPKPVKAVVTGPYTLAKLSINRRDIDLKMIVEEFTEVIAKEIAELVRAGAELVQIDEPAILKNTGDFPILKEAIEELDAEKGRAKLALYTYFGDAVPLYEQFLELSVDALGFDFTYSPKLEEEIIRSGCSLDICLGLVDGRNTKIDEKEKVIKRLKRMLPALKGEHVYLSPSCGLGEYLPREIAYTKLQNIVAIAQEARELI